jgi:hypothetical protein
MALPPGHHRLGPDSGELLVRTYREGAVAKVGHDLIIEVRSWEARLDVGSDGTPLALELDADAGSLHAREGLRGLKPLSDRDRREIRRNMDKTLGTDPIAFRSEQVETTGGRHFVRGALTMHETARPAAFELVQTGDGGLEATADLVQSEWGITPYRGLMGALKVRDALRVAFEGHLP